MSPAQKELEHKIKEAAKGTPHTFTDVELRRFLRSKRTERKHLTAKFRKREELLDSEVLYSNPHRIVKLLAYADGIAIRNYIRKGKGAYHAQTMLTLRSQFQVDLFLEFLSAYRDQLPQKLAFDWRTPLTIERPLQSETPPQKPPRKAPLNPEAIAELYEEAGLTRSQPLLKDIPRSHLKE